MERVSIICGRLTKSFEPIGALRRTSKSNSQQLIVRRAVFLRDYRMLSHSSFSPSPNLVLQISEVGMRQISTLINQLFRFI